MDDLHSEAMVYIHCSLTLAEDDLKYVGCSGVEMNYREPCPCNQ